MRRTVLLKEYGWKGPWLEVVETMNAEPESLLGQTTGRHSEPGRGTVVVAGREGGLSGACRAQQGCWSQGTSPDNGLAATLVATGGCILAQAEWSSAATGGSTDRLVPGCRAPMRLIGKLHQAREASTTAAMILLRIENSGCHWPKLRSVIAVTVGSAAD